MAELTFEWDAAKASQNIVKHGLGFEEAKTVFNDPAAITVYDAVHSDSEERWLELGISAAGKLLVVWYAEREERIRIIGCRNATKMERGNYERQRTR